MSEDQPKAAPSTWFKVLSEPDLLLAGSRTAPPGDESGMFGLGTLKRVSSGNVDGFPNEV